MPDRVYVRSSWIKTGSRVRAARYHIANPILRQRGSILKVGTVEILARNRADRVSFSPWTRFAARQRRHIR